VNELAANASAIEHADALDWLARQEPGTATATLFDPPCSRYSPMRGREDGAAGSVAAPFSSMHRTMRLCATVVRPKGIVIIFLRLGTAGAASAASRPYPACASRRTWPGAVAAQEAAGCSGALATRS
jgi:hypothetical protein